MLIFKYYVILIVVPLTMWSGYSQFVACVKAEPGPYAKGMILGALSMLHAWLLLYIFTKYYYIVKDF